MILSFPPWPALLKSNQRAMFRSAVEKERHSGGRLAPVRISGTPGLPRSRLVYFRDVAPANINEEYCPYQERTTESVGSIFRCCIQRTTGVEQFHRFDPRGHGRRNRRHLAEDIYDFCKWICSTNQRTRATFSCAESAAFRK